jgi:hypothetical protein
VYTIERALAQSSGVPFTVYDCHDAIARVSDGDIT